MRRSRKWLLVFLAVALTAWLFYAIAFDWLLPKTATLALPGKWNLVPLGQPKATVHGYLGEPVSIEKGREEWVKNPNPNKQLILRVYYHADSLATSYSVRLTFNSWLINREYLIDSASIR